MATRHIWSTAVGLTTGEISLEQRDCFQIDRSEFSQAIEMPRS